MGFKGIYYIRLFSYFRMPSSWLKIIAFYGLYLSARLGAEPEPIEGPPLLFTKDFIPAELQAGERFELSPLGHVVNFGYEFRLSSDFGEFDIRGIDMLAERVHEIAVLDKLEEISKTKAFTTSFSEALKDPVVKSWSVARRPISSVIRIPGGILRYLQGKFYQVKRGSEKVVAKTKRKRKSDADKEESENREKVDGTVKKVGTTTRKLSRRHFGFEKAKRAWARRLKVDPYSTNEYLQLGLERIAWASTVGSFAGEFGIPTNAVLSYTLQTQEMVWNQSATELERRNFVSLGNMGVEHSALLVFNDLGTYTLTEKTLIVLALENMEVEGRLSLVQLLMEAESRDEAQMMVKLVTMFGNYHRLVHPINCFSIRRGLAVAELGDGSMILPLALDYLHWTPEITDALLSDALVGEDRTLWIEGVASTIAKRRLEQCDWKLEENSSETFKWLATEL
jgi:hypothetical protein